VQPADVTVDEGGNAQLSIIATVSSSMERVNTFNPQAPAVMPCMQGSTRRMFSMLQPFLMHRKHIPAAGVW
jgi:hypothetical protein